MPVTQRIVGNCAGQTDLFFPSANGVHYKPAVARAQAICQTCPVTLRCYQLAVDSEATSGVWAGIDFSSSLRAGRARIATADDYRLSKGPA